MCPNYLPYLFLSSLWNDQVKLFLSFFWVCSGQPFRFDYCYLFLLLYIYLPEFHIYVLLNMYSGEAIFKLEKVRYTHVTVNKIDSINLTTSMQIQWLMKRINRGNIYRKLVDFCIDLIFAFYFFSYYFSLFKTWLTQ